MRLLALLFNLFSTRFGHSLTLMMLLRFLLLLFGLMIWLITNLGALLTFKLQTKILISLEMYLCATTIPLLTLIRKK